MGVRNLNLKLNLYAIGGFYKSKVIHKHGQDTAFSNHEVRAVESSWTHLQSLWWKCHYHALAIYLLLPVRNFCAKNPTGAKLDAKDSVLNSTIINLCSNLFGCIPFQR